MNDINQPQPNAFVESLSSTIVPDWYDFDTKCYSCGVLPAVTPPHEPVEAWEHGPAIAGHPGTCGRCRMVHMHKWMPPQAFGGFTWEQMMAEDWEVEEARGPLGPIE